MRHSRYAQVQGHPENQVVHTEVDAGFPGGFTSPLQVRREPNGTVKLTLREQASAGGGDVSFRVTPRTLLRPR